MLGSTQRTVTLVTELQQALRSPAARTVIRLLYYLAVLFGLVVLYGRGDFSTAGYIYQAF